MNDPKEFPLLSKLMEYTKNPMIALHMPAHAAGNSVLQEFKEFLGENIFKMDLTELDELDNLTCPTGVIRQTEKKISEIYNSKASYILVNGSTVGILTIIYALAHKKRFIVARNCHKSVINGLVFTQSEPIWIMPDWLDDYELFGAVNPITVENALKNNPEIDAVIITSPTYEGISSDIKAISTICKKYQVKLIVDQAHGGHWKFSDQFPEDALSQGADAVVHSLHKTCGSLSQSSLLHISRESGIEPDTVKENLNLFHTTSPSYILMASLDAATSYLTSTCGKNNLDFTFNESLNLRSKLSKLKNLSILDSSKEYKIDPTRIFLKIKGLSGYDLAELLENKYNIGIESANNQGILIFFNIGNSKEDINQLYKAIQKISDEKPKKKITTKSFPIKPIQVMMPEKAFNSQNINVTIEESINKIAAFSITKCPPGYPIIISGELITEKHLHFFEKGEKVKIVKA